MRNTTPPKKRNDKSFTIVLTPKPRANLLPIQAQIQFLARSKRHDKSNTRMKQKRWKRDI